jgi:hypothetical protein
MIASPWPVGLMLLTLERLCPNGKAKGAANLRLREICNRVALQQR